MEFIIIDGNDERYEQLHSQLKGIRVIDFHRKESMEEAMEVLLATKDILIFIPDSDKTKEQLETAKNHKDPNIQRTPTLVYATQQITSRKKS